MYKRQLNACVHTPAGTPITLKGGADPVRGQVWLDVHDRGPGIPPERAETIFERFRTTRPGGLGLGLSIVRGFMAVSYTHLVCCIRASGCTPRPR